MQGLTEYKMMGIHLHEKAASTGTLTRIVTNTMEQNKGKSIFATISIFVGIHFIYVIFKITCT